MKTDTDISGDIQWKKTLAFPSDIVCDKTKLATTSYCDAPVEMETRLMPRQHRKKRILPLHPRRLSGRTDTDTFFASIPSIRKYKCIQLFVIVKSCYLFVRFLQRESQSHTALQDFIREVGAPVQLLSDNAKTQTGKLWTSTTRQYAIKQRKTVPDNQNQNVAERNIQEVKKLTVFVLRQFRAPLVFWCYCMAFVIDCLNHRAKKGLDWRTPLEIHTGDTPDISAFRFYFWQPVEVFNANSAFPESKMISARFLGIAWEYGDAFTYRVWTEPEDGGWKKGKELVRNFVRPRTLAASSDNSNEKYDDFCLMKQAKQTRKRKRSKSQDNETLVELSDVFPQEEDTLTVYPAPSGMRYTYILHL